jgi:hypothetical protein
MGVWMMMMGTMLAFEWMTSVAISQTIPQAR